MSEHIMPINSHKGLASFTPAQTSLIHRTAAKDCGPVEFDEFMHVCARTGLDPLRKQIYALVYNKNNPAKRNMTIIVGIDGYRTMASRTGTYRPNDKPSEFVYRDDLKGPANPLGIESCTVTVYKWSHDQWHPVVATAYWDEYAPITDTEWQYDQDAGKRVPKKVDPTLDASGKWSKMPRQMIEKCATAKAIRSGWPDDFSGIYEEAEMDQANVLNLTPSEWAEQYERDNRLAKVGGKDAIMLDLPDDNDGLRNVPIGKFADEVIAYLERNPQLEAIEYFEDRNRAPMQEFWARAKSDALELKRKIEAAKAAAPKEERQETHDHEPV